MESPKIVNFFSHFYRPTLSLTLALWMILAVSCRPEKKIMPSETIGRVGMISLQVAQTKSQKSLIDTSGKTIETRFRAPEGYERTTVETNSFKEYLRNMPLKRHGSKVKFFNGSEKEDLGYWDAVVDLPIGNRDLHQCADAIIRLRAEYLWSTEQYDKIHYNFVSGFNAEYRMWKEGHRIRLKGNDAYWVQSASPSNSRETFWKYLEMVFSYAGTPSLEKELKRVDLMEMEIGDVFIKGGSPGHAVLVVDMAVNPTTGEQLFMLTQSYMPAQEIHVLANLNQTDKSPWYSLENVKSINTPDWRFGAEELSRFEE